MAWHREIKKARNVSSGYRCLQSVFLRSILANTAIKKQRLLCRLSSPYIFALAAPNFQLGVETQEGVTRTRAGIGPL